MKRPGPMSLVLSLIVIAAVQPAFAQGPAIDTSGARTAARSSTSTLGPSPGADEALNEAPGDSEGLLMARPGRGGPRIPATLTRPSGASLPRIGRSIRVSAPPAITESAPYGPLAIPEGAEDECPPNGLTLDLAIERLIRNNLDLLTQSFEIPQAEADILTASLRSNPLLYADVIYLPYQRFSNARPGGPTQYDVSVTWPVDVSHKRRSRIAVACRAKRVLEAQYQDAVRLQIANLYTTFVDVLAARETVRFSRASLSGVEELLNQTDELRKAGHASPGDVNQVRVQRTATQIALRDALTALRSSRQDLAVLLNLPDEEADALQVRGSLRVRTLPLDLDRLVGLALEARPDIAAYRLGVARAEADVGLALANRYQDVYLLYGPYIYQDNSPFQRQSAVSGSLAMTVPLPLFNRNQGNIQRARLNVSQTRTALEAVQRRAVAEVRRAYRDYDVTRSAVEQIEHELLPAARKIRDETKTHFLGGDETILAFHEAQRNYNDVVRQYRDVVVRHRRSMLNVNTAVGLRILP